MRIEYDPAKSRRDAKDRGLSFDQARELLEGDPITVEDTRRDTVNGVSSLMV
jgi:uncharacterized DUF497 family protein